MFGGLSHPQRGLQTGKFFPCDQEILRSFNADLDLIRPNLQNGHRDAVANDDAFTGFRARPSTCTPMPPSPP